MIDHINAVIESVTVTAVHHIAHIAPIAMVLILCWVCFGLVRLIIGSDE